MVFHFHEIFLCSMYDFEGRRAMAVYVANNVIENDTLITTAEQTEIILGLLAPLIQDQEDGPTPDKWDDPEVLFFIIIKFLCTFLREIDILISKL